MLDGTARLENVVANTNLLQDKLGSQTAAPKQSNKSNTKDRE